VLIAGVNLPQQGDVKVDTLQQGQADDAQIATFAFGVTALRATGWGFSVSMKGVEVGAIEDQAAQLEVELARAIAG